MTEMTKMAWEEKYSDDSGVAFAVRFDAAESTNEGLGAIEFECVDKASFPLTKIDWLIDCLQKIKAEQGI